MFNRHLKPRLGTRPDLQHPSSKGLVGEWPMLEGGGDKTQDGSGKLPPGLVVSENGWVGSSRGSVVSFNDTASQDYVDLGKPNIGTSFTITFWEFSTGVSDNNVGYFMADNVTPNWANLFLRRAGTGELYDAGVGDVDFSSFAVSRDVWHYNAFIHYPNGDCDWYVDNVLRASISGSNFNGLITNLWLGNRSTLDRDFFGMIDNVKIYNRSWTAPEIKVDFLDSYARYRPDPIIISAGAAPPTGIPILRRRRECA